MLLQRAEDIADGDVHFLRRLDTFENDQAALFKNLVELSTHGWIGERLVSHTFDDRAELQIIAQVTNFDSSHRSVPSYFIATPHLRGAALFSQ